MIPHIVAKKAIGGIYNKTPREGEENTNTSSVYHQRVCRVDSTLANKRTYSNTHKETEVGGVIPNILFPRLQYISKR